MNGEHAEVDVLNRSASIAALAAALAKAQGEMPGAMKDSLNPHFKSKYADLASIWDACRGPLSKHELAVIQLPRTNRQLVTVETILAHSSGEWIGESLTLTAVQDTPQAVGSAITYGRRYGLAAVIGIAPEDDDGNAATHRGNGYTVTPQSGVEELAHSAAKSTTATSGRPDVGSSNLPPATIPSQRVETVPKDGRIYIVRIDVAKTKNPNVKRHTLLFSNQVSASTINDRMAALASELCQERKPVWFSTKETKWGSELTELHYDSTGEEVDMRADEEDEHGQPLTDDQIPF